MISEDVMLREGSHTMELIGKKEIVIANFLSNLSIDLMDMIAVNEFLSEKSFVYS